MIIIITILLCLLILILINQFKESFNSKTSLFLNKNDGCKVINTINYKYNQLDKTLRGIPNNQSINDFYCDHLLDFSSLDKKLLKWVIDGMREKIPPSF